MKRWLISLIVVLFGFGLTQNELRIGLAEDPDALDPDLGRTFVGRIVFASLCDKLFDITPGLEIIPQLASGYSTSEDGLQLTITIREGVLFHDGTPLNAEAVKYNIERSKNFPGSNRASELSQVDSVDVIDDLTVQLNLSQPFSPLIALLADRSGMMVSPTAAEAAGENFSNAPVCAGPFKFVERIAQDRIVLEKFADYWDAGSINIDKVTFLPIPDGSVRLANLQSGDLDMIERVQATDLETVRGDSSLVLQAVASLGYGGITINLSNGGARDNPLANDVRVREAFDLAIDRTVINQVINNSEFVVGNQAVSPASPWYVPDYPIVERDVERAKALLAEAGVERVAFELMVANSPTAIRTGEVIQSLAAEAGFDISINATEFATALNLQEEGNYDAFLVGWSGRVDPDGNIHQFQTCEGNLNEHGYCDAEVDAALNAARAASDTAERFELYKTAAMKYLPDRHIIYIEHSQWFTAHKASVTGFVPYPDGMIRLQGVSMQ